MEPIAGTLRQHGAVGTTTAVDRLLDERLKVFHAMNALGREFTQQQ